MPKSQHLPRRKGASPVKPGSRRHSTPVIHAFDYKNNMPVAIKIIRNKKRFYQQALVEVRILEATKNADPAHNIVRLYEYFVFRNHLCLVFELLGKNLFECAKRNKFRGFPTPIVQSITSQMLSCLTSR
ncbi:dual-specificity tyrosine-(Y)-phosphorylation regulated kinase [Fonticula alba]|uniref:Dual-specificity tyrosine-(Y)-phosphorylation regulated kinase n=1 Tax=Fonticula alba TaxID=691883 RepID=A0A058Z509_FONAL|nr:dual-specificity tyrosine-(Y)-phosphorylation regulated kinase [Fonticula alba]KCV68983.1 dual-specificity tyrosine-(Y)-phosphorylation regulated kinase [Fonticula alba]|eukprot:XP_009496554.1 dual-specificity tyrosine-(Y)-phosphorylation regulated kinase [Fonticula alba]